MPTDNPTISDIDTAMQESKNKTVTSKDVARMSGYSQSAVSRAFSPNKSIKPATKKRIHEVAKMLGYRPNALARSLITNKSNIIAIIVGNFENLFYPFVVEKLSRQLQKKNYRLLFFFTDSNRDVDAIINQLLEYRVDGVIVASVTLSSSLVDECYRANIPVVLFNRVNNTQKVSSVESNNLFGGLQIAKHLMDFNHKKCAFIAGDENASTSIQREQGFRDGLQEQGQTLFKRAVGSYDFSTAVQATLEICQGELPDAIFVASDHMAIAVLDTLRYRLNLRVPEDISVVGYDNIPISSWETYQLTTFSQPVDEMVNSTLHFLLDNINTQKNTIQRLSVEGEMLIRQTTANRE